MKSRYRTARRVLIFWCLFIGIGAVFGSIGMLIDPTGKQMGMDAMLPYFQVLPFSEILFQDLFFSGIALLIVNGLTNLTAAVLLLRNRKSGIIAGTVFGVTLMLWICIQFYMFPLNVMSTLYFFFGLFQMIAGICTWVFRKQEAFTFDPSVYSHIGENPHKLVVYFSRMGYTAALAYEEANASGAEICEIKAAEHTAGTSGFWWCGRYGMHRWAMPIEELPVDPAEYEEVTICSPIWVFSIAAPVRSFCRQQRGRIRKVNYLLCHHMSCDFEKAADEMDKLLDLTRTGFRSVCCREGVYR